MNFFIKIMYLTNGAKDIQVLLMGGFRNSDYTFDTATFIRCSKTILELYYDF